MVTLQIWVNDDNYEALRRLKAFFEYQQEEEFEGKSYKMSMRRGKRKRIRKDRINDSYVFNQALNTLWIELENRVRKYEKQ